MVFGSLQYLFSSGRIQNDVMKKIYFNNPIGVHFPIQKKKN